MPNWSTAVVIIDEHGERRYSTDHEVTAESQREALLFALRRESFATTAGEQLLAYATASPTPEPEASAIEETVAMMGHHTWPESLEARAKVRAEAHSHRVAGEHNEANDLWSAEDEKAFRAEAIAHWKERQRLQQEPQELRQQ